MESGTVPRVISAHCPLPTAHRYLGTYIHTYMHTYISHACMRIHLETCKSNREFYPFGLSDDRRAPDLGPRLVATHALKGSLKVRRRFNGRLRIAARHNITCSPTTNSALFHPRAPFLARNCVFFYWPTSASPRVLTLLSLDPAVCFCSAASPTHLSFCRRHLECPSWTDRIHQNMTPTTQSWQLITIN